MDCCNSESSRNGVLHYGTVVGETERVKVIEAVSYTHLTYVDTYTYSDTDADSNNTGDGRNDYSDTDADSHNTGFGYIFRRNRGGW